MSLSLPEKLRLRNAASFPEGVAIRLSAMLADYNGGMDAAQLMQAIDIQLSHVWMVRTFLKHSEEAAEDDELAEVHRELYDFMLALGGPLKEGDAEEYLRLARKKFRKLQKATELFLEIQPEVSLHTNFFMATASLRAAVWEVERLLAGTAPSLENAEGMGGRESD